MNDTRSHPIKIEELYVAPNGSDKNPGTKDRPFKTLSRARLEVRKGIHSQENGIRVYVREGTYYLSEPLVFTPEDSGTAACPVSYCSYPGEKVILSGGIRLNPSWEVYRGKILRTKVDAPALFDQLFVNGQRQILARYPNHAGSEVMLEGYAADCISRERVSRWKNPAGGYVRGLEKRMWGGNSYRIKGIQDGEAVLEWVGDNNRSNELHPEYRMVENIFEELDAPGEWFYDAAAQMLYFYPPDGLSMEHAQFEAACLEELVKVCGTSSDKVRYLTFDGFTFTHTYRTLFSRPYEGLLRGDWSVARAGAVFLRNAENITLQNSTFDQVGGNAICISGYNRNHRIDNNDIFGAGATCILVAGLPGAVRCPSTWENHRTGIPDKTPGPLTEEYPRDITISYNHLTHMGVFEKQTAGVCLSMCQDVTVSHNTIHHSPRSGININDGCWGGHVIEYNDVFDCMRESGDHGPFNSWGRDRFWSYTGYNTGGANGVEKRPYALLDAWKATFIRNNRFHANGSWGIDLDDGSSHYEIYNNLCLNMGFKLREGFFRKVYNNVIINGKGNFHVSFAESDDRVERNIFVSSAPYAFIRVNLEAAGTQFDYNLFWNHGGPVETIDEQWRSQGFDRHSLIGDPLFIDPSTHNYAVKPDSPAHKTGFINFPMDRFGKPGCPTPPSVRFFTETEEQPDPESWMGAVITSIFSEGIQSAAGIGDFDGAYLYELPSQCYAQKQSFLQGDVIRRLNGIEITTKESFWKAYNAIPSGQKVQTVLIRNQQEHVMSFEKE